MMSDLFLKQNDPSLANEKTMINKENEKIINRIWNFANSLVGKTIHAENDFDARRLAQESKDKARSHEWLYHCTDTNGLLGILKSREFWLTNLQDVNDSEEAGRIDASSYEKSYFVCCFTYDPAIPDAHWKEYGTIDEGVIIGVKKEWFLRKPVFMTTACQKCHEDTMKIYNNHQEALDVKISREIAGYQGFDPYHIFDFDFYQIIYDNELKKSIVGDCTINFDGVVIPGRSISQNIPGIIKSCSGMCKREGRKTYLKNWEDEKEVRLKVGVHRLSHNEGCLKQDKTEKPYFKRLSVPLHDDAFDTIKIAFSPQYRDRNKLLEEIHRLYPDSILEEIK